MVERVLLFFCKDKQKAFDRQIFSKILIKIVILKKYKNKKHEQ